MIVLLALTGAPLASPAATRTLGFGVAGFLTTIVPACVLVAFRRKYLWVVWASVTGFALIAVGLAGGPSAGILPAIVVMFSLAAGTSIKRVWPAAVAAIIAQVVVILAVRRGGFLDGQTYVMTAWTGVALFAGATMRNRREVLAAAHERARLAEATREEEAQRRVTEERLRIARDLHDVVAHHVSAINVQAGVAAHLIRRDPDGAAEALGHIREASRTVLREIPTLLGLLRTGDEALQTAPTPGLAAVGRLIDSMRHNGLAVTYRHVGGPVDALPPRVDVTAYRVIQEALTNAARHGSGPCEVRVTLAANRFGIEVRNPAPAGAMVSPGRHGLVGMRERVVAVGGALEAGPHDRGGGRAEWVVAATIPLSLSPEGGNE
ncbi:MAG: histidine kinase [Propionibacteriaceae bacterium]|nr:histidine kinase [Propionibacteriaceae bacterium]